LFVAGDVGTIGEGDDADEAEGFEAPYAYGSIGK
jgi:hypothetical protein